MGDLIPGLDTIPTIAQSYLLILGRLANKLTASLIDVMNTVMPTATLLRLCFTAMGAILTFHLLAAMFRGVQEGNPKGLGREILDAFLSHGVRVVVFVMLALGATSVTTMTGSASSPYKLNTGNVMAQAGNETFGGTFYDLLGSEEYTVQKSMAPLQAGVLQAIKCLGAINIFQENQRIANEINKMVEAGKNLPTGGAAGPAVGGTPSPTNPLIGDGAISKFLKDAILGVAQIGLVVAGFMAQYSIAKSLILTLVYMNLAWRLTLHFLPLVICLAYFRSLQGFLLSAAKQLIALSLAAAMMGAIASVVFSPQMWFGSPASSTVITLETGGGILGKALSNLYMPDLSSAPIGSLLWVKSILYPYMIMVGIMGIFGALGVFLGELYGIVRSTLDGAMRASYSASIASTFGK